MRGIVAVATLAVIGFAPAGAVPVYVTITRTVDVVVTVTESPGQLHSHHHYTHGGSQKPTAAPAAPTTTAATSPPAIQVPPAAQTTDQTSAQVTSTTAAAIVQTPTTYVPPAAATTAAQNVQASSNEPNIHDPPQPDASYQDKVIWSHNIHRENHTAPMMVWNQTLANIAQQIAQSCVYGHNVVAGGGGYGQNIAAGPAVDQIDVVITNLFYNGEVNKFLPNDYGQPTPPDFDASFESYGHFTQVVWQSSTSVGCASVNCRGVGGGPNGLANVASDVPPVFAVCNYYPPGNYIGEFNKGVLRSIGMPSVYALTTS